MNPIPHAKFNRPRKDGSVTIKEMYYYGDPNELQEVLKDAAFRIHGAESEEYTFPWYAFPQMWGSTRLGHGGIGGQAMTTAHTYVCINLNGTKAHVYFGKKFAYTVHGLGKKFYEALYSMAMPSTRDRECLEDKDAKASKDSTKTK